METMNEKFEIIRPYNDDEINPALLRVISNPLFKDIVKYLYDGQDYDRVIESFKNIDSIYKFQKLFSDYAVKKTVEKTSSSLTHGGIENLDSNKSYLFIANHRDIVLDSAIMQILLLGNGHKTSQITFGSNLMSSQFIIDLGKMNKMFTFYRGGNRVEQYHNAMLHSAYIHHTIKNSIDSIWIAQRDGRTKDGNDKTQIGLIKMLLLGHNEVGETLKTLNIVPITTSYEFEPCDFLKVRETYCSENSIYVKTLDEDFHSVMYGITGFKGKIHVQFGTPLNDFITHIEMSEINQNLKVELIVQEIDRQIYSNYKLYAVNYIAYDLFHNQNTFENEKYKIDEKERFINYVKSKIAQIDGDKIKLQSLFYKLYANVLINFLKTEKNAVK